MDVEIKIVDKITSSIAQDIIALLPQLTEKETHLSKNYLEKMILSSDIFLFVAENKVSKKIVGVLVLIIFRILVGVQAHIEDVIVDEAVRGQGIGERLVRSALSKAEEIGVQNVYLTSNPKRVVANALYRKIGFHKKETNIYRYQIKGSIS